MFLLLLFLPLYRRLWLWSRQVDYKADEWLMKNMDP